MNQHGVVFTDAQRRELQRANRLSNKVREKQIAEADLRKPKDTQPDPAQLRTMGKKSDFIISRQSKKPQDFKSMEDFERYIDKQHRIQSGEYLDDKTRLYKSNYMKAVANELDDPGIAMRIRMMKPDDFRKLVEDKGEDMEISYVYDPSTRQARRNRIRELLGMKPVEDEDPHYN